MNLKKYTIEEFKSGDFLLKICGKHEEFKKIVSQLAHNSLTLTIDSKFLDYNVGKFIGITEDGRLILHEKAFKGYEVILPEQIILREKPITAGYDFINPSHYTSSGEKEVWEMMVDIWGKEAFIKHCEMTAFKYRMRAGKKPDQSIERDMDKARWYENKAKELRS